MWEIQPGTYDVVDPFLPAFVASPAPNVPGPTAADALTRVAQELAHVLTTPAVMLTNPFFGVQNVVTSEPAIQAQEVYHNPAAALTTIPYKTVGPALYTIATSGQLLARLWAMNCLLYMGDASLLESVEPVLLDPSPDVAYTVGILAHSMEGHVKSPAAVPTMSALLASQDVAVRRAAAYVLRDIGTKTVIAPLATLALYDEDQQVRYYAVTGLAGVTGAGHAPAMDLFEENEPEYVDFWRRWAMSNRE